MYFSGSEEETVSHDQQVRPVKGVVMVNYRQIQKLFLPLMISSSVQCVEL